MHQLMLRENWRYLLGGWTLAPVSSTEAGFMREPEDTVMEEPAAPITSDTTHNPREHPPYHHQDGFSISNILNEDSESLPSDLDSFASPIRSSAYNLHHDTDMTEAASDDIRCVCENTDDDGFTIQCDDCLVWQHAICVGISKDNVPDSYFCDVCRPDLHQKVWPGRCRWITYFLFFVGWVLGASGKWWAGGYKEAEDLFKQQPWWFPCHKPEQAQFHRDHREPFVQRVCSGL